MSSFTEILGDFEERYKELGVALEIAKAHLEPTPQEPEWEVRGGYSTTKGMVGDPPIYEITVNLENLNVRQGAAIEEAIEALMTGVYMDDYSGADRDNILDAIDKAHTLIQKGKS